MSHTQTDRAQADTTQEGCLGFGVVGRSERDEVPEHLSVVDLAAVRQTEPTVRSVVSEALAKIDGPGEGRLYAPGAGSLGA